MDDPRDPEATERFASAAPEAYLRRREFLQRTAVAGGLAAGLGTILGPDVVLGQAAKQARRATPSPRNLPIDTIVVLMMENRSFDHYLGWLPGADGRQEGPSTPTGRASGTPPAASRRTSRAAASPIRTTPGTGGGCS